MEKEVKEDIDRKLTEELLAAVSENPEDCTEEALSYMLEVLKQSGISIFEVERLRKGYKQKDSKLEKARGQRDKGRWIMVKNFPSRLFAEQAKEILEDNGITSIIKGEDIGILGPGQAMGPQGCRVLA